MSKLERREGLAGADIEAVLGTGPEVDTGD